MSVEDLASPLKSLLGSPCSSSPMGGAMVYMDELTSCSSSSADEDTNLMLAKFARSVPFEQALRQDHPGVDQANRPQDSLPLDIVKAEQDSLCGACGQLILDRVQLRVNDVSWHVDCLRCCTCDCLLEKFSTCFFRDGNVYCKQDYARQFGARCAKCARGIQPADWVRRARDRVYHLACFACEECRRQLSTGEEFALHDGRVLCKAHFQELVDPGSQSTDENGEQEHNPRAKTKRVRTTFTEEQLQVLQANFNLDSNPDGQDLERIAQITGLSKRVTQVWFQNSRARQKKYFNNQSKNGHSHGHTHSSGQHINNNNNNNNGIGASNGSNGGGGNAAGANGAGGNATSGNNNNNSVVHSNKPGTPLGAGRASSTTPCVACGGLMYCVCSPNSSVISPTTGNVSAISGGPGSSNSLSSSHSAHTPISA
ncbi:LIM/homeobox protein Awh-like isoform X2 [Varroa jacobsoni]|uniref:LIM/homeobox protein Awh n=1 Tax=Varroa destructor TaxID=109461 RepID=A0A7M7JLW2_VARDE|nr:LIM/homeobox protein Awh-like isoform X2 [Varroa destructor]XP_022703455.1 LIM/homeobox protein Awh-like isoform X2 [Varroa jacobsoni]